MPSETFEQLLDRAASICGIEPGFWDIWGRYHLTTVEAKQALVRALGIDSSGPAELERALAQRTRAAWERLVAPAVVAAQSATAELSCRFPPSASETPPPSPSPARTARPPNST